MRGALVLLILVAGAPSVAALDTLEGDLDLAFDPSVIAPAPSGGSSSLVVEAHIAWRIDPTGCSRLDARVQEVTAGFACPALPAFDTLTVASEGEAEVVVAPAEGRALVETNARAEVTTGDVTTDEPMAPALAPSLVAGPVRARETPETARPPSDASRMRPEPRVWTQGPGPAHAAPPPAPPAPVEPAPSTAPDLRVASWAPILPLPPLAPDAPVATLAAASAATLALVAAALYQRLRRAKALEHPARAALHAACATRERAGTAGDLARATGLARKTADYHLGYLARLGLLRAIEGPPRRYATQAASASAPEPLDARLLAALAARPGLSAPALAVLLGETRARIDRRAKALVMEGALEARREKGARRFYASPSTDRSAAR